MGTHALRPPKPKPRVCECGQPARISWHTARDDRAARWCTRGSCTRCYNLKTRYGITLSEYEARASAQEFVCGICRSTCITWSCLSVDHSHTTGAIRGLLCHACNQGLGKFNDDPALLEKAAAYLRRHGK